MSEHEEAFIRSFVVKDMRERLTFEIGKRRERFLRRFCHNALEILDLRFVSKVTISVNSAKRVEQLLIARGAPATCYAISSSDKINGEIIDLGEALAVAVGFGFPSVISCVPGKLCYVETEQVSGPPDRLIVERTM